MTEGEPNTLSDTEPSPSKPSLPLLESVGEGPSTLNSCCKRSKDLSREHLTISNAKSKKHKAMHIKA
eukprot:CAMPEP_0115308818 /NCGR_PEP_ID=MMETSP0270-20121206/73909_1 /TAXON_ID=71861 /ORGANISM="Scrippsiella trochoidea, Strain CCMP3099" /LENGTH=66 /DNA_ID=CAMNT_0002727417 /DNA_START=85 /DNA_END=285 /DNA_ORIENTATION=+